MTITVRKEVWHLSRENHVLLYKTPRFALVSEKKNRVLTIDSQYIYSRGELFCPENHLSQQWKPATGKRNYSSFSYLILFISANFYLSLPWSSYFSHQVSRIFQMKIEGENKYEVILLWWIFQSILTINDIETSFTDDRILTLIFLNLLIWNLIEKMWKIVEPNFLTFFVNPLLLNKSQNGICQF